MKNLRLCASLLLLVQTTLVFAGVEWEATIVHKVKDEVTTNIHHVYAQGGMVREEFTQVEGKSGIQKKGTWWLYKGQSNTITIVDPGEKTYFDMSFDSLMHMVGALGQLMQVKISNAANTIEELSPESVSTYLCRHVAINNSYDLEMKVLIMKVKSHIEQRKEMWTINAIPTEEVALAYSMRSIETGIKPLDSLIEKDIETYKNLGFIIKSLTTETTTTKGKSETSTAETTISNIITKDLGQDLFTIPEDYKRIEFKLPGGGE